MLKQKLLIIFNNMKKKVFSLLAIIMFIGGTLNARSISVDSEDGRASDCARMARATVMALAEFVGDDVNGENLEGYLTIYHGLYSDCYNN